MHDLNIFKSDSVTNFTLVKANKYSSHYENLIYFTLASCK